MITMKRFRLILALVVLPQIFAASHSAEIPEIIGILRSDTFNTLFGSRIVPAGDQNRDGYDDFFVWDFSPRASLYLGGPALDTVPFLRIDTIQSRISNIGDIDGDSLPDFVSNGRNASQWRLNTYLSGGGIDTVRDLWFGLDTLRPIGFAVNGRDINASSSEEIILNASGQKELLLFELSEPIDSIPDMIITPQNLEWNEFSAIGEGIASGDFNGDDTTDLVVSFRSEPEKGELWFYWGGVTFDTIPDLIIKRPGPNFFGAELFGTILVNLGDVNGDGYDDIYAEGGNGDTTGFIFYTGPNIDTIPDVTIAGRAEHAAAGGDLNNDGYMDLITSFAFQANSFSWVNIYYGGPNMDSLPDIRIDVADVPGFRILWGMNVAGLGDVNGDGIDDFAVASVRNERGVVHVFAGVGLVTDVEIIEEPNLPTTFELYQNYPNPFNPETTIEFSLLKREHVSLEVYNILGQKVRELVNKQLSSGHYRVSWDGTDNSQKLVASGMYYYKLQVGESFAQTKKMILLK
jgi:FlgD Ig-like domain